MHIRDKLYYHDWCTCLNLLTAAELKEYEGYTAATAGSFRRSHLKYWDNIKSVSKKQ
ncbi:hypothetical protein GQ53DRAFT_328749 [Thozetella sp. PMI_491]|nr:hypothetical protein GQ53DRAFT_328749 [Thozetella sp. PMI_491]